MPAATMSSGCSDGAAGGGLSGGRVIGGDLIITHSSRCQSQLHLTRQFILLTLRSSSGERVEQRGQSIGLIAERLRWRIEWRRISQSASQPSPFTSLSQTNGQNSSFEFIRSRSLRQQPSLITDTTQQADRLSGVSQRASIVTSRSAV